MKKAIVLSETPNGMATRVYPRDPHDLGPTFNAMREAQRQQLERKSVLTQSANQSTWWAAQAQNSAAQANYQNAYNGYGLGYLGSLFGGR